MGYVIKLEGLGKILTERQTSPIVLNMFKTVSPERGGDAMWSAHEHDDNYLVVWRT